MPNIFVTLFTIRVSFDSTSYTLSLAIAATGHFTQLMGPSPYTAP
ncbi:hypothetical protein [Nostoc sp.]